MYWIGHYKTGISNSFDAHACFCLLRYESFNQSNVFMQNNENENDNRNNVYWNTRTCIIFINQIKYRNLVFSKAFENATLYIYNLFGCEPTDHVWYDWLWRGLDSLPNKKSVIMLRYSIIVLSLDRKTNVPIQ